MAEQMIQYVAPADENELHHQACSDLRAILPTMHPSIRRWIVGLPAGMLGLVLCFALGSLSTTVGSSNAWAQSAPSSPNLQQRVRELEERLRIIELEHEALERRMHLEAERTTRVLDELDKRLRACETHALAPAKVETPPAEGSTITDPHCQNPYMIVSYGVRRVRPGCESAGNECDPPFAIDPRGVRKFLPACVKSEDAGSGCASPFFVDPAGVKRVKPECI